MYFGGLYHDYALNCQFVYLVIQGTCQVHMRKQNLFVYSYAAAKINVKQSLELPVYDKAENLVNFMLMILTN